MNRNKDFEVDTGGHIKNLFPSKLLTGSQNQTSSFQPTNK